MQNHNQRARLECKKHKRSRQSHVSKEKYSQNLIAKEESVGFYPLQYSGAVPRISNHIQPESQPIRPNSLDIHSSYFNRQQAPFSDGTKPQYPPPPPAYTEHPISPQQHYPPPPYVAITPERQITSPNGTPTRNLYRVNSRPSQPPPAPPATSSASSSGSSTPTVSAGTPSSSGSRYKSHQKRDNLPPPPPPPVAVNSEIPVPPSPSKSSEHTVSDTSAATPPISPKEKIEDNEKESIVENVTQISSSNSSGTEVSPEKATEELVAKEPELPPPPPIPEVQEVQTTVASSPNHHPPPPPPPPPLPPLEDLVLDITDNGSLSENQNMEVVSITSESASETSSVSKLSEHFDAKCKFAGPKDGRSDLLAAIREGKLV